jgi:hypothetical protein
MKKMEDILNNKEKTTSKKMDDNLKKMKTTSKKIEDNLKKMDDNLKINKNGGRPQQK